MELKKKDTTANPQGNLGRRDLMKMSVGAGAALAGILNAPAAAAAQERRPVSQAPTGGLQRVPLIQQWPEIASSETVVTSTTVGYRTETGAGWVNNSGRAFGNGPMDECTKRLVEFTANFSEKQMTPPVIVAINHLMADFLACFFSGYETDPGRASARLSAKMTGTGDLKSTVFGYGITTTPEMAAFANGGMGRHSDYDDHNSALISGVFAVAEMLHSTGAQTMQALAIAYEIQATLSSTIGISHPQQHSPPRTFSVSIRTRWRMLFRSRLSRTCRCIAASACSPCGRVSTQQSRLATAFGLH